MAKKIAKKLAAPATVTVVFEDSEVVYTQVLQIEEDEDGRVLLTRQNNYVRINSDFRYYEVEYGE